MRNLLLTFEAQTEMGNGVPKTLCASLLQGPPVFQADVVDFRMFVGNEGCDHSKHDRFWFQHSRCKFGMSSFLKPMPQARPGPGRADARRASRNDRARARSLHQKPVREFSVLRRGPKGQGFRAGSINHLGTSLRVHQVISTAEHQPLSAGLPGANATLAVTQPGTLAGTCSF